MCQYIVSIKFHDVLSIIYRFLFHTSNFSLLCSVIMSSQFLKTVIIDKMYLNPIINPIIKHYKNKCGEKNGSSNLK